jgi:hypothetical protein
MTGSAGNWNRILTAADKEEKENISNLLNEFITSYIAAKGSNASAKLQYLIDNYNSELKDWRYYFIKYEAITNYPFRELNLFSWKDKDGYDINSLGNSGGHPLHSYHLNPYLIVIKQHFKKDNLVKLYYGRFADISCLRISDSLNIQCSKEGWKITTIDNYAISENIVTKYSLKLHGASFILFPTDKTDRIKIAVELIKDLLV